MGKKLSLSDEDLAKKTDRIVQIRPLANEYRSLCDEVKKELLSRGSDVFTAPSGNQSAIKRTPSYTWVLDMLKRVVKKPVFETLCPRKPDANKLKQRLAATPEDKKLAACLVPSGETKELEVLSADEVEAAKQRTDEVKAEAKRKEKAA